MKNEIVYKDNKVYLELDSSSIDETIEKADKLRTLLIEVRELIRDISGAEYLKPMSYEEFVGHIRSGLLAGTKLSS